MPESLVHSIAEKVGKLVNPTEPAQEPVVVQEAQEPNVIPPASPEDRTTQGLSRRITKQDQQIRELNAKLAAYEVVDGPQGVDRAPNQTNNPDEREVLTREITSEVRKASDDFDWRGETERLRKELAIKDTALRFKNDPVASRLLAAGVNPDSLSDDLLSDLRAAAAESEYMTEIAHNPVGNRAGSQDEQDARVLKQLNSLF